MHSYNYAIKRNAKVFPTTFYNHKRVQQFLQHGSKIYILVEEEKIPRVVEKSMLRV